MLHDAQMDLVSSIPFLAWNVYAVEGEKAAELPAEARKENQERAGDAACSPGISVHTRTRIYWNPLLWISISGVISWHRAGPAGVDHPNTVLFAGILVFQEHFQSHFLVEDLWILVFPKCSPGLTSVGNRWLLTQRWALKKPTKNNKKRERSKSGLCTLVLILPNHSENKRNTWGPKIVGKRIKGLD